MNLLAGTLMTPPAPARLRPILLLAAYFVWLLLHGWLASLAVAHLGTFGAILSLWLLASFAFGPIILVFMRGATLGEPGTKEDEP